MCTIGAECAQCGDVAENSGAGGRRRRGHVTFGETRARDNGTVGTQRQRFGTILRALRGASVGGASPRTRRDPTRGFAPLDPRQGLPWTRYGLARFASDPKGSGATGEGKLESNGGMIARFTQDNGFTGGRRQTILRIDTWVRVVGGSSCTNKWRTVFLDQLDGMCFHHARPNEISLCVSIWARNHQVRSSSRSSWVSRRGLSSAPSSPPCASSSSCSSGNTPRSPKNSMA